MVNGMYKEALKLVNKISALGYETYIIGGFPRDKYLGKRNKDIDICTQARYDDLKKFFKIKSHNFGSMRIRYGLHEYEVTTFRKEDVYTKNRFPKSITYVDSLKEDLERRDFVINTLCIDRDGKYVDLLNAKDDIDKKIIRCVGDCDLKISQDILRSLRAIRFATILDFDIDPYLQEAIKKYGHLLNNLSDKRKKEELKKIYKSPNRKKGIQYIIDLGLYQYLKDFMHNI